MMPMEPCPEVLEIETDVLRRRKLPRVPHALFAEESASPVDEVKAKIVLAGVPGVGKTSLVRRYVLDEFSEKYRETLGAVVYKRVADVPVGARMIRVTMTVWDVVGGWEETNPFRDIDLYGAQGILAVCDVTDEATVSPLRARVDAALKTAGDVPVQILMNKADLGPQDEAQRESLRAGLEFGMPCYLTSAKEGVNVSRAFEDLAERILERTAFPPQGLLDAVDREILVACAGTPRAAEDVAASEGIASFFAEARIDRLVQRGLLRLAGLGLDARGRPKMSYARTRKPVPSMIPLAVPA